jgi:Domain of unknown function (DUF4153)
MNKKTISIICLTAIYSLLFYEQNVGINFLLFTVSVIGFFFYQYKESIKDKTVLLVSFGAIFAASFNAVHGSYLSMWATIVSLMILPGIFINKRSNVFLDFATTLVNIATSTTFMIIEMIESGKQGKGKGFLRLLKYLVPIVFVIAFFFIYRAMNPLFEKFTQEIAEIISLGWVFFTLGGFVLIYSIYKQKRAKAIDSWEENWLFNIDSENIKTPKWNETVAFTLLFIILNLMLISVNAMDINYLYLGEGMPDGLAHKQFVHKGVGMLILSIILGISILLYFFRGSLNFMKNKNAIKILAYLWVAQNMFMVVSTGIRNTMYINEALLSYKRIGVYFWLFFALFGLITLIIKLFKNKTIWFLAKYNLSILFIVLVASSSIDFDMVISNFNIDRAKQRDEISSFDKKYMLSLSEGNIAGLFSIKNMKGFEVDSVYSFSSFNRYYASNEDWLDNKVYRFLLNDYEGDWRSFSLRRNRVINDIKLLDNKGHLAQLNLQGYRLISVAPLSKLKNLKELNLLNRNIKDWKELENLKSLEKLSISYVKKEHIEYLKKLKKLKTLNANQTKTEIIILLKKELPNVTVY